MSGHIPEGFVPITLQRIFDLAWQKFIIEDAPPAVENGTCRYRTSFGGACAVGLALPPTAPDGHSWSSVFGGFHHIVKTWPELFDQSVHALEPDLFNHFQRALHDALCMDSYGMPQPKWALDLAYRRRMYLGIADEFGLTVPPS